MQITVDMRGTGNEWSKDDFTANADRREMC